METYLLKSRIKKNHYQKVKDFVDLVIYNTDSASRSIIYERVSLESVFLDKNYFYIYIESKSNLKNIFEELSKSNLKIDLVLTKLINNSLINTEIISFKYRLVDSLDITPFAVSFCTLEKDSIVFNTLFCKVKITSELVLVQRFLSKCDGQTKLEKIAQELDLDKLQSLDLYSKLEKLNIVIDSKKLYSWFHKTTKSNTSFKNKPQEEVIKSLTQKPLELVKNPGLSSLDYRQSFRNFKYSKTNIDKIQNYLNICYFDKQYWTPSAGSIYPLQIFCLQNLKSQIKIYKFTINKLVYIKSIRSDLYNLSFNQDMQDSSFSLVIVGDLSKHSYKYSNRGYRYTLLEAGHLAQNFYHLNNQSLSFYEYGGFDDQILEELLGLDLEESTLISIIAGKPHANGTKNIDSQKIVHQNSYLGLKYESIIKSILLEKPKSQGEYLGQVIANCVVANEYNSKSGFGYSYNSNLAVLKATAEALERYYCGFYKYDFFDTQNNLSKNYKILDPVQYLGYDKDYYQEAKYLDSWNKETQDYWKKITFLSDQSEILCHSDILYYPITGFIKNRNRRFAGSSTGVAAHTDYKLAFDLAVYELCERDALAVSWYTNYQTAKILDISLLPNDIKSYIKSQKNLEFIFLEITLDLLPVVLCLCFAQFYPYLISGGGCDPDPKSAIYKAFYEARYANLSWQNTPPQTISKTDIQKPFQHGKYYADFDKAELVKKKIVSLSSSSKFEYGDEVNFMSKINPMFLDLKKSENALDLNIVRVLSEYTCPLNFGYGLEPVCHKRFKQLGLKFNNKDLHLFP